MLGLGTDPANMATEHRTNVDLSAQLTLAQRFTHVFRLLIVHIMPHTQRPSPTLRAYNTGCAH